MKTTGAAGTPRAGCDRRSGQAITELVIGLIAILVLFMGLLQLQQLARAHTRVQLDARQQAGLDALSSGYLQRGAAPKFIHDWEPGPDNARYSQDDVPQLDNPGLVSATIVPPARPADLANYATNNPVSQAASAGSVLTEYFFVHGYEQSPQIPLYPVIRSCVYGADELQMQANAWLTWTHLE